MNHVYAFQFRGSISNEHELASRLRITRLKMLARRAEQRFQKMFYDLFLAWCFTGSSTVNSELVERAVLGGEARQI